MTNSDCYYLAYTNPCVNNAGSKPMVDAEEIMRRAGFRNIGIKPRVVSSERWSHHFNRCVALVASLFRMPRAKAIILQYPMQDGFPMLFKAAKAGGNRVIVLIHDLNELRGGHLEAPYVLEGADLFIAHTSRMAQWLRERFPGKPVVELGVFDFLSSSDPVAMPARRMDASAPVKIVFAGNLRKAFFLKHIRPMAGVEFHVYGNRVPEIESWSESVVYEGSLTPDELQLRLPDYDYGLVWDGDSLECCTGEMGNYLRYNSPFKTSSYLAAGLPVIYWNEMGIAPFMRENGLGIGVDSLADLPAELAKADREAILRNVEKIRPRIAGGAQLTSALERSIDILNNSRQ